MVYIKLFKDDDSEVSGAGVFANAVIYTLRADLSETDEMRLYAKADDTYNVTGTIITPTGARAAKWCFAPDVAGSPGAYGAYGAAINLGAVGDDPGEEVYFWAKAKAEPAETPIQDNTVTLVVSGTAAAE